MNEMFFLCSKGLFLINDTVNSAFCQIHFFFFNSINTKKDKFSINKLDYGQGQKRESFLLFLASDKVLSMLRSSFGTGLVFFIHIQFGTICFVFKYDNLQYNTLGCQVDCLIDQASDIPSIIFFRLFTDLGHSKLFTFIFVFF